MFPETPLLCALFYLKGPAPAVIGYAFTNLLYAVALSHKAVLKVLLTMWFCYCRYGNVYPSSIYAGISLFIIRQAYVYVVVCVLTRITLQKLRSDELHLNAYQCDVLGS